MPDLREAVCQFQLLEISWTCSKDASANCGWVWINHVKVVKSPPLGSDGGGAGVWDRVTVVVTLHKSILSFSFSQRLKTTPAHPHVRSLKHEFLCQLRNHTKRSKSIKTISRLSLRFRDIWPDSCPNSKFTQTTNCYGDKDTSKFHDNFMTKPCSAKNGLAPSVTTSASRPHNIWYVTFDVNI